MAKTLIKEPPPRIQTGNLWQMTRARGRLKVARDALGENRLHDDTGKLILELLLLIDGVTALLDKRIAKAKRGERLT